MGCFPDTCHDPHLDDRFIMPGGSDTSAVLVIGASPIVIGQAAGFYNIGAFARELVKALPELL